MAEAKKKEKKEEEKVTKKKKTLTNEQLNKYTLIAGIIGLIIVLGVFYFMRVFDAQRATKISESYLLSSQTISLEIKNLEEVSSILKEAPSEYFVLINYTKNQDTYNLEKGLKPLIDNYNLADHFYYLDVSSIKDEDNYIERINNAFDTDKIDKIPTILYYRNNKLVDIVKRVDNNPINAGDFQKLLDIYLDQ